MIVEIRFRAEEGDSRDLMEFDGSVVTMKSMDRIRLVSSVSMYPDGEGGKVPGKDGVVDISMHGDLATFEKGTGDVGSEADNGS